MELNPQFCDYTRVLPPVALMGPGVGIRRRRLTVALRTDATSKICFIVLQLLSTFRCGLFI